ncbi:hypothetical protein [Thalassobellus suaedae]|uniref:Secreted protein n=1 Tax=Thalassobellus suaedae TaxID=3074124 RepID=A0ABY9XWL3_9FLAO|nr:hypothetical protein RHP51_06665 [Flavobacteriaceae bacterium HL-DH14]
MLIIRALIIEVVLITMKYYFSFLVFTIFTLSAFSQIDSRNNSISIPAVESPKDSIESNTVIPEEPIKSDNNKFNALNTPKVSTNLNFPKKEFSMFPEEKFGNPGELYQKNIDKQSKVIKDQLELGSKGSKIDVSFGDFITKSEYIYISYRDYGAIDGDVIRVTVNDEIIELRVFLSDAFKGFKFNLKKGVNKIEFLALDEGYALPNTAHFRILDDQKRLIATDLWSLSIDVKGTINIIKE